MGWTLSAHSLVANNIYTPIILLCACVTFYIVFVGVLFHIQPPPPRERVGLGMRLAFSESSWETSEWSYGLLWQLCVCAREGWLVTHIKEYLDHVECIVLCPWPSGKHLFLDELTTFGNGHSNSHISAHQRNWLQLKRKWLQSLGIRVDRLGPFNLMWPGKVQHPT